MTSRSPLGTTAIESRARPPVNWRALAAWIAAALVLLPFQFRLHRLLEVANPIAGTESAEVAQKLQTDFDSPFSASAVLVMSGLAPSADPDSWRAAVRNIVAPIAAHGAVTAVISPASSLDTMLLSRDRTVAIAMVGLRRDYRFPVDSLRELTKLLQSVLHTRQPNLALRWTGESALLDDLHTAEAHAVRRGELRALPVTALVAIWALGLTSAIVAVGGAVLVVSVGFGLAGAFAGIIRPTLPVQILVPLLGIALTVDYSLYLTRRGREGAPPPLLRRTVMLAAAIVAIGFAGLALAPAGELRAAATGGILVAVLSALAAITLTPAQAPFPGLGRSTDSAWRRWGIFVTTHPWLVLLTGGLPLGVLAWHVTTARLATPLNSWLPAELESVAALRDLQRVDRAAAAGTIQVLIEFPAGTPVLSPRGWDALVRVGRTLRSLPETGDVRSLATIGTGELLVAEDVLPAIVKATYVSRDGQSAVLDVTPDVSRGPAAATALVRSIRRLNAGGITGVPGSAMRSAGLPAYALDYETAIRQALPGVVIGVSLATFLVLLITLRAPFVAAKAVTLNLLVATAAIGATVLVFQDGFGIRLLGDPILGSIFPTVPLLAFGGAFGISMDYELFLLSGVMEARREGKSESDAIVEGIARTGGLITRAALIMVTVFVAFATSDLLPIAMVGFALATAVILDATVVRLGLAPAMLQIAGRWNWWPGNR